MSLSKELNEYLEELSEYRYKITIEGNDLSFEGKIKRIDAFELMEMIEELSLAESVKTKIMPCPPKVWTLEEVKQK